MTALCTNLQLERETSLLDAACDHTALQPAYQPIIELTSGTVVGYEGLARWPSLTGATPDVLFALARREDRVAELDAACCTAAVRDAVAARLQSHASLFVNVEPASLVRTAGGDLLERAAAEAVPDLRVVVELTERELLTRPSLLLSHVARIRALGWGLAMDDVGAHPDSLALLDLLMPDVVKLDLALIQQTPRAAQARTLAAVMAHAERTGCAVLAEGIETEAHHAQALALGATLGQGWAFGAAAALPVQPPPTLCTLELGAPPPAPAGTPFELVAGRTLRIGSKHLLLAFSRHMEHLAFNIIDPPVVLSTLQTAARLTPATDQRYERLAGTAPLVALFGAGLSRVRLPRSYRTVELADGDPLTREWVVVVLGAHTSAALIARDLGDDGPDAERRFEFVITYDRELVTRAARSLTARLAG